MKSGINEFDIRVPTAFVNRKSLINERPAWTPAAEEAKRRHEPQLLAEPR
jgi:hypothetical protein